MTKQNKSEHFTVFKFPSNYRVFVQRRVTRDLYFQPDPKMSLSVLGYILHPREHRSEGHKDHEQNTSPRERRARADAPSLEAELKPEEGK